MMNNLRYFFLSLILAGFITACETDFDTTTDWEDITVVYGLLDQLDSVYYIKINKAFLGDGNALVYAEQMDSINYEEELEVTLEEINENGGVVQTIYFTVDTIPESMQGENDTVFPGAQKMYVSEPFEYFDWIGYQKFWLNDRNTYRLNIFFPSTGKEVTSETVLVERFEILYPLWYQQTVEFTNNPIAKTLFKWEKPDNDVNNAFRYEIDLLFHYQEVTYAGDTADKVVYLASATKDQSQVNEEMTYTYNDESFFVSCENQILYDDEDIEANIKSRQTGNVEFIVSVAAEEYNFFMEVYQPSNSVVQEKPPFTNIENGIGILSARYYINTIKDLHTSSVIELKEIDENVMKFEY